MISLLIVMVIYFLFGVLFYYFSNFIIFQPPVVNYTDTNQIIKLKTKDGALISAIYIPSHAVEYTILVSHGNAEDLGSMMPFLEFFHGRGFAIFAYDYHGYGTSTGTPNEKNTYLDIDAACDYLITQLHIPLDHIILYGHSLGAAVAIDLAARKPAAGLIIESPFITAYRTVTQIAMLPFDKYNNLDKIKKVNCPVLVIHGKLDKTIPFWQGVKLYDKVKSPKYSLWLDEADHNDAEIIGGEQYWQALIDFSKSLN